jgi:hypothetical protein
VVHLVKEVEVGRAPDVVTMAGISSEEAAAAAMAAVPEVAYQQAH